MYLCAAKLGGNTMMKVHLFEMPKVIRLSCALLPIVLSACGDGCGIPGHKIYTQCFYYYTNDMTPTKVNFQHSKDNKPNMTLTIPKAYIITALPYTTDKTPVLPDEITLRRQLTLWVGRRTGKPLKVTERYGRRTEYGYTVILKPDYPHRRLNKRSLYYDPQDCGEKKSVKIGSVGAYNIYRNCLGPEQYNKPEYGVLGYIRLISQNSADHRSIECWKNPMAKIRLLCRHYLRVRDGLDLEVSIRSFRRSKVNLEAGLLRAEREVASILNNICPIIECDPKHKNYYDNLGES